MTIATELPAPEPAAPGCRRAQAPITMLNPDFPFSYDHYLAHPDGLGAVPPELHGTEVAVVGAGLSGLVTAYELMKLGLRPVVYEADRIGGRLRTASFPSAAGRRRRPRRDALPGVRQGLLPLRRPARPGDPGLPQPAGAGDLQHGDRARGPEALRQHPGGPAAVLPGGGGRLEGRRERRRRVHRDAGRHPRAGHGPDQGALERAAARCWTSRPSTASSPAATPSRQAGFAHREVFGQVGFGTGGWDTDFPNSILEILRVVYTDADDQHRLIVGGAQQLPRGAVGARAVGHGPLAGRHLAGVAARRRPARRRGPDRPRRRRRLPDPGTLGPRIRLPGGGHHLPVLAAVDPDPHRRGAVPRRTVDGDRTLPLHAVLQDLRHGRPAVLEGHRPGDRPRRHVHDADRPAEPCHLPAGQRPGPARRDPAVLHLERRRAEVAVARRGRAGGAHAALAASRSTRAWTSPATSSASPSPSRGRPTPTSWAPSRPTCRDTTATSSGSSRHFKQDGLPAEQRGIFLAGDDVSFTAGWAEGAVHHRAQRGLGRGQPPRRLHRRREPGTGRAARRARARSPWTEGRPRRCALRRRAVRGARVPVPGSGRRCAGRRRTPRR